MQRLIFCGCVVAGFWVGPGVARAQPASEPPSPLAGPQAPAPSPDDYAGQAHAALKSGRALEAGQILMVGYRTTGDLWALRMAGQAFERAGRPDLALAAWGRFLCTSPDSRICPR